MVNNSFMKKIVWHTIFKFIRDTEQYIIFNSNNHQDTIDIDSMHLSENELLDLRNLPKFTNDNYIDSEYFLRFLLDELHSNHKDMYFQIINRLKYAFVFKVERHVETVKSFGVDSSHNIDYMMGISKFQRNSIYGSHGNSYETQRMSYKISYKEILTKILNAHLKEVRDTRYGYSLNMFNVSYSLNNIFKYNTTSIVAALLYPAMYYDTPSNIYPTKVDPYYNTAPSLEFNNISSQYTKYETLYGNTSVHVVYDKHIYYVSTSSETKKYNDYSFAVKPMKKDKHCIEIEKLFDSHSAIVRNS